MGGLIIGFIVGFIVKVVLEIALNEYQFNREFRKAKIEVCLDKLCENAYNHGYELGRLEERVRSDSKLKELYESYTQHIGEKGET